MNGGLIATIISVIALLATFLLGRKTGASKEAEKASAYAKELESQVRSAETKTEAAEKKSELASKVAETIAQAAVETSPAEVLVKQVEEDPDADLMDIARQQVQRAQEFMLR